jgi:phage anti-repressor protein
MSVTRKKPMPDLIPIVPRKLGGEIVNTVDARDLYVFLDIDTAFTPWIKRSLVRANQLEDVDFTVYAKNGTNPHGGRPSHEYYLTFDAAKHIAMMSSATKGHEVRAYFIQKEKELARLTTNPDAILDRYPELRAIAELAVSVAQARDLAATAQLEAAEARAEAAEANANALRALNTQSFFTVAEYVVFDKLTAKVRPEEYRSISDYMYAYCHPRGIPIRNISVAGKAWKTEYGYHYSAYADAFPGWLKQRFAQQPLKMVPRPQEDGGA